MQLVTSQYQGGLIDKNCCEPTKTKKHPEENSLFYFLSEIDPLDNEGLFLGAIFADGNVGRRVLNSLKK